jgi:hypothetical protein
LDIFWHGSLPYGDPGRESAAKGAVGLADRLHALGGRDDCQRSPKGSGGRQTAACPVCQIIEGFKGHLIEPKVFSGSI